MVTKAVSNLNNLTVYPNPFVPYDGIDDNGKPYSDSDLFSGIIFDFGGIVSSVEIEIYTISGRRVQKIEKDNVASIQWDGKNDDGNEVASGGYLYVIKSSGDKKTGKLAIIR